ncbi:hypothetical protein MU516_15700 [Paracoccus sp. YLB-12]|uniref:Uncharacterized protein n=1 Tax=Paracoccus maritimus TaxID=2933292 RepID=A0ABT2KEN0_9RHOB|nr:hypothetical protein [Paracoccus sp. YLB-12]
MTSNAACWRRPAPALVIATISLTACATGGSDPASAVCPPVVAYDQPVQERAAAELEAMPEDAVLVGMMADYAVMRAQARVCEAG